MIKDLANENEELRKYIEDKEKSKEEEEETESEELKKRREEGVMYEDYSFLSNRIDKMETSIGSIINKVFNTF
jgi:hypothetical protein